jgi:hypothetical protein
MQTATYIQQMVRILDITAAELMADNNAFLEGTATTTTHRFIRMLQKSAATELTTTATVERIATIPPASTQLTAQQDS